MSKHGWRFRSAAAACLVLAHGLAAAPCMGQSPVLTSPDGSVVVQVGVDDGGRLTLTLNRHEQRVLEPSPLGIVVDDVDLGAGVALDEPAHRYEVDDRYPWLGHASHIRNQARGMRLPVRHASGHWELEVRAYDDGAAWRYVVPGRGPRRVSGEATAFHLPASTTVWSHGNTRNYEAQYRRYDADNPGSFRSTGGQLSMPMTAELPGGGLACLNESDVMHYSGMTLRPTGQGRFEAVFEDDAQGWTLEGPFASPWRVCIAVDDLNGLVNSTIVHNVAPPPNVELFPQGAHTDWLRPGRSLWQWWFYGWDGMNWDRQRTFVDAAAALNCHYYLVDDGWEDPHRGWITDDRTKWDSLQMLVDYGKRKHVQLWVWRDWQRLRVPAQREAFFERLARIGVVGVKVDFMNSESQERLAFYRDTLEAAARHRLMVNFHGANKSAGETRTWPNEMTREAVFGLEQNKGGPVITLEHYTALPFTAFVTGPKDFTPTTFRRGNAGTTQAFQLATAVIYTSPVLCWANRPDEFLESPAIDLIRHVPTVWDQTVVLPGNRIGQFVAFARRHGDEWWVGVISGSTQARSYALDLSFLGAGSWRAMVADDKPGDGWELRVSELQVTADQTIEIRLEPAGGYVARLVPQGP